MRAVFGFLVLFSVLAECEVTFNENVSIIDHGSRIRQRDCAKLAINWKNYIAARFSNITHHLIFLCHHVSFVKLSSWFKSNVNIITGSGVMTIFICKGLTKKSRNQKCTHMSFAQYLLTWASYKYQIWHDSNKMFLNAAKYQNYNIYIF